MTAVDLDDQPGPFEPLRERDYRYFFVGNVCSQVGTFCQAIAQSLLAHSTPEFLERVRHVIRQHRLPAGDGEAVHGHSSPNRNDATDRPAASGAHAS